MKEIIKHFNNEKVHVIMKGIDPYFRASDICKNLGLKNVSQSLAYLEIDDIISSDVVDRLGRCNSVFYVSEAGLFDLLLRSRKKEAMAFKKWVTHEVLPSIRKTGQYSIPESLKSISTKNHNMMTDAWKEHGITKKHHYIQLTLQEYKALDIKNKKKDMTKHELLRLAALEAMESLKLFEIEEINGYYDCKNSLIDTSKKVLPGAKDLV